ncbi:MAG TPA: hypothetical protein VM165_09270, partial [Planctomycetaceae bacterium]|nr:hypothetical protein [Planctomycetaceae bacterium]
MPSSGMPLYRRYPAAWWFVCGLLAATIGLAVCRSACAGDVDGDAHPELLILDTGDQLRGYSRGVENGELLWQPDEGRPVRIPVGLIDRLDVAPVLTTAAEIVEEVPPSPTDAEASVAKPVGPNEGGEEPPWIEEVPLISLVPKTYHFVMGSANVWTQRFNFGGQFIDGNAQTDLVNVMVNCENGPP